MKEREVLTKVTLSHSLSVSLPQLVAKSAKMEMSRILSPTNIEKKTVYLTVAEVSFTNLILILYLMAVYNHRTVPLGRIKKRETV